MNSDSIFIVCKIWELVEVCSEKRRRCRWVNLAEFRNALDCWQIGRKEAYAALRELEQRRYLLAMTRGEDDEITEIVITPPIYRCPDCRLMVTSCIDWEDHLPDCLREREKLRRIGPLA
jgi:hypothetical protein